LIGVTLWDS
jgi:hypothetical protein